MNKSKSIQTVTLDNPVSINTLSTEEFQKRAEVVFDAFAKVLVKTLGAYGAPTIIAEYPYAEVTKDGYHIAANMEFSFRTGEPIDRCIASMARDICFRLNHSVGDGTTSAIVATNEIYKAYRSNTSCIKKYRPSFILKTLEELKKEIIKNLQEITTPVSYENLEDVIKKIVHISSNGNEQITDMLTRAYKELGYPSIICQKSDTNETKFEIVDGFRLDARLGDAIYINNDNDTAHYKQVDVIIFDHKVTISAYEDIIKPLTIYSRRLNRHLICLAPIYDEHLLDTKIKSDTDKEYRQTGTSTLIICTYPAHNASNKKAIADLAMLLHTTLITKTIENEIIERTMDNKVAFHEVVNILNRNITGIYTMNENLEVMITPPSPDLVYEQEEDDSFTLRVGFADEFTGGMKSSIFVCSSFSKLLYEKYMQEAQKDLDNAMKKYSGLGTRTMEIYEAQIRLSSLKMKLAIIHVGGDTEQAQGMLEDSVNDAILAAKSAFQFGYIHGCHVDLLRVISNLSAKYKARNDELNGYELEIEILKILYTGYRCVYRNVLLNAFPDDPMFDIRDIKSGRFTNNYPMPIADVVSISKRAKELYKSYGKLSNLLLSRKVSFLDMIIATSIDTNQVFDLNHMHFNRGVVINSVQTDIEILTATIDLLAILITGSQVVMPRLENLQR